MDLDTCLFFEPISSVSLVIDDLHIFVRNTGIWLKLSIRKQLVLLCVSATCERHNFLRLGTNTDKNCHLPSYGHTHDHDHRPFFSQNSIQMTMRLWLSHPEMPASESPRNHKRPLPRQSVACWYTCPSCRECPAKRSKAMDCILELDEWCWGRVVLGSMKILQAKLPTPANASVGPVPYLAAM